MSIILKIRLYTYSRLEQSSQNCHVWLTILNLQFQLYSFQYGNNLVYIEFYFLLATKTLHDMDPTSQTLKKKKKMLQTMKGTLEISLQFKKLTNNSATSFIITFGLQCIIDEMIHVHNTHYTPPVHRLVSYRICEQSIIGRTLKNIFKCRHLLKML